MKLIKPSYKILNQPPGLQGIYEQIELAGRTCYASSHKIQYQENDTCNGSISTTAKDFVDRMIASQHYAMLEHGTVYLKVPNEIVNEGFRFETDWDTLCFNPYTRYSTDCYYYYYTTNYRVIIEHNLQEVLKYLCEPTEFHEKRVTVGFTTSNGIMRELTRHRSHSFAVESTRYCNYSKNKFNNEIQCVIPSWCKNMVNGNSYNWELVHDYNIRQTEDLSEAEARLIMSWCYSEAHYLILTNKGILTAQQAREVLPLATKCDMVMTGFVSDWKHLFRLRTSFIAETGKPHPDMSNLCDPLYKEFVKKGFIEK